MTSCFLEAILVPPLVHFEVFMSFRIDDHPILDFSNNSKRLVKFIFNDKCLITFDLFLNI